MCRKVGCRHGDFAVIGITTDTKRLVVKHKGRIEADMPITALSDEAPVYERPFTPREPAKGMPAYDASRPVLASRNWNSTEWFCRPRWF